MQDTHESGRSKLNITFESSVIFEDGFNQNSNLIISENINRRKLYHEVYLHHTIILFKVYRYDIKKSNLLLKSASDIDQN